MRRVPFQLTCRLLEGREAQEAIIFPVWPPRPRIPIAEVQLNDLLVKLRQEDPGARQDAAHRLIDAEPIEARRSDVVRALEPLLEDTRGGGVAGVVLIPAGPETHRRGLGSTRPQPHRRLESAVPLSCTNKGPRKSPAANRTVSPAWAMLAAFRGVAKTKTRLRPLLPSLPLGLTESVLPVIDGGSARDCGCQTRHVGRIDRKLVEMGMAEADTVDVSTEGDAMDVIM